MALPFPPPSSLLSPQFALSRAAPADVPQMAECYVAAFRGTPSDHWWPPQDTAAGAAALRRWTARRLGAALADPLAPTFKVVDGETGRVVAYARWNVPETMRACMTAGHQAYDAGEYATDGAPLGPPEGADAALYDDFFGGIKRMGEKWGVKEKLDLCVLATHPDYQGRGIARALVAPVLALADGAGVEAYLEALPAAAPMYRDKFGFERVDFVGYRVPTPEGRAALEVMIRRPVVA